MTLTLLALLGCSEYGVNAPLTPQATQTNIALTPSTLDFGDHIVNERVTDSVSVRNEGDTLLHISAIAVEGSAAFDLDLAAPTPWTLDPGEERTIDLGYTATASEDLAWLHVLSDDLEAPDVQAGLRGGALLPALEISPLPLDFGPQPKGIPVTGLLTLKNVGSADLLIDAATLTANTSYALTPLALPLTIAPGAQELATVTYTPATSHDVDTLTLHTNMPADPTPHAAIVGRAAWPKLVIDPPSLDFGDRDGCGDELLPITLRNEGELFLRIDGIDAPPELTALLSFPVQLPPGGERTFNAALAFGASDLSGSLVVHSTDPDGDQAVPVRSDTQAPVVQVTPTVVDFGANQVGCGSPPELTVLNLGPGCARVDSVELPAGVALASWVRPLPFGLHAGEQAPIALQMSSDGAGFSEAAAVLTNVGRFDVTLAASPAAPVVLASDVDLGHSTACRVDAPVTLTNLGPGCAEISALNLPDGVTTAAPLPIRLAPGATRDVLVQKTTDVAVVDGPAVAVTGSAAGDASFWVATQGPAPSLVINEPDVDFTRDASSVCRPADQAITLTTDGTGCVKLTEVLTPPGVEREWWSGPLPYVLQPGETQPMTFVLVSALPGLNDQIEFTSTTPGGITSLPTTFLPPQAQLEADPLTLDFGSAPETCELRSTLILRAVGDGCVNVNGIDIPPAIRNTSWREPPFLLSASWHMDVNLTYTTLPDDLDDQVLVRYGEPEQTLVVPVTGTTLDALSKARLETFEQLSGDKVDVLFWIDQSGSMVDNWDLVAAHAADFAQALAATGLDYQLMIVNSDTGCNLGGIWTPATPDLVVQLQTYTYHYSDREQGLWTTDRALSASGATGCNSGFLRPDAITNAVLISDEPEQSDTSPASWATKLTALAPSLRIHSIVDTHDLWEYGADAGYHEASLATGGAEFDIYGDWSTSLPMVAQSLAGARQSFVLQNVALADTVTVAVNGVDQTTGWRYDGAVNAVRFDDAHTPPGGSTIEIRYDVDLSVCP